MPTGLPDDVFDPVFDKQFRIAQIATMIAFGSIAIVLIIFWRNPVAPWLALGIAGFGALQILMFHMMRQGNLKKKKLDEN